MASGLKLITSRRAYEFRMDDLRLSLLCMPKVQEQIRQAFSFQAGGLATPQPTFGPVVATVPPGLVFNVGLWEGPEGPEIPIRFLHFEPTRIVIDVAGPSSTIDSIFRGLCTIVGDLAASDGSPAIGGVQRTLDYSEFSGQFSFDLVELFTSHVRDLFVRTASSGEQDGAPMAVVPTIVMHTHRADEEYAGIPGESRLLQISVRAGTRPADGVSFSSAPLGSEVHREYLSQLEEALVHKQR